MAPLHLSPTQERLDLWDPAKLSFPWMVRILKDFSSGSIRIKNIANNRSIMIMKTMIVTSPSMHIWSRSGLRLVGRSRAWFGRVRPLVLGGATVSGRVRPWGVRVRPWQGKGRQFQGEGRKFQFRVRKLVLWSRMLMICLFLSAFVYGMTIVTTIIAHILIDHMPIFPSSMSKRFGFWNRYRRFGRRRNRRFPSAAHTILG